MDGVCWQEGVQSRQRTAPKGAIRKGGGGPGERGVRQENMVGKRQQKEEGEVEQAR